MSEQFKLTSEDEAVLSSQDDYKYGFHDDVKSIVDTGKGISDCLLYTSPSPRDTR